MKYTGLLYVMSGALLFSSSALAQIDIQIRLRQQPGWDPRAREGRCEWQFPANHPLPYNSIRDFQLRQIDGPLKSLGEPKTIVRIRPRRSSTTSIAQQRPAASEVKSAGWGASKSRITERSQFWRFRFGLMELWAGPGGRRGRHIFIIAWGDKLIGLSG